MTPACVWVAEVSRFWRGFLLGEASVIGGLNVRVDLDTPVFLVYGSR